MTEKRYKAIPETVEYKDTATGEILSPKFEKGFYKVLDLLNEKEQLRIRFNEEREKSLKFCRNIDTLTIENKQLKQQLDYIQNSISHHIEHQKTEVGQKALKEIIKDYNEWLLGHKINKKD